MFHDIESFVEISSVYYFEKEKKNHGECVCLTTAKRRIACEHKKIPNKSVDFFNDARYRKDKCLW